MQNLLKRAILEQNKVIEFRSLGSQVAFTLMNALSTGVLAPHRREVVAQRG
jgi:hypothetical protein